jgi:hypothetical protein
MRRIDLPIALGMLKLDYGLWRGFCWLVSGASHSPPRQYRMRCGRRERQSLTLDTGWKPMLLCSPDWRARYGNHPAEGPLVPMPNRDGVK